MLDARIRDRYEATASGLAAHSGVRSLAAGAAGGGAGRLGHRATVRDRHRRGCGGPGSPDGGVLRPGVRDRRVRRAGRTCSRAHRRRGQPHRDDPRRVDDDTFAVGAVVEVLRERAGRLIWNGWPTGVAVGVGDAARRPLAFLDQRRAHLGGRDGDPAVAAAGQLPGDPERLPAPALQDGNPWSVPRRVDGAVQHRDGGRDQLSEPCERRTAQCRAPETITVDDWGRVGKTGVARIALAVLVFALLGCSTATGPAVTPTTEPPATAPGSAAAGAPSLQVTGTITTGLAAPWGMAFLPDGSALGHRAGHRAACSCPGRRRTADGRHGPRGRRHRRGRPARHRRVRRRTAGPHLFAYFTAGAGQPDRARSTSDGSRARPRSADPRRHPARPDPQRRPDRVRAGRLPLRRRPATPATADAAQDRDALGGKILRITPDGEPAPGNPFAGSPVWTLGHRNVQGLAWDAARPDVGQRVRPEHLGRAQPDRAGPQLRLAAGRGPQATTGVRRPAVDLAHRRASPSGHRDRSTTSSTGGAAGRAAVAGPAPRRRRRHAAGAASTARYGRLRAVAVAPDGSLWVMTNNTDGRGTPRPGDDRILRVTLT